MSYVNLDDYHIIGTPTTTLTVAAAGADYTTIKAAVAAAVAAASANHWYRVYIYNGIYNEIQMNGGNFVIIEGESRAGVIIVSDGLRTDIDPVSGQRYVDMAQATKHGFLAENTMEFRNLTIRVNDVKYCIHADIAANPACYMKVYDCTLEHSNGFPVGCGSGANTTLEFESCTFVKLGAAVANGVEGSHGLLWHNRNAQVGATHLILKNCTTINCGLTLLEELDSNYTDLCKFTNCTSGEARGVRSVAAAAGVDYNINILTISSTLTIDNDAATRPNGGNYTVQE